MTTTRRVWLFLWMMLEQCASALFAYRSRVPPLLMSALLMCVLSACSESPDTTSNAATTSKQPAPSVIQPPLRLATDDLPGMVKQGSIRFLAPRFDGADALPRDGAPVLDYQALASVFAKSHNLAVEWVFVDDFSALIPALQEGKGDVIVTNMTVTRSRADKVTFTREVAQVSELLIARKDQAIASLESLSEHSITLVDGTVYGESLEQTGFQGTINWLKGVSPSEILSRIEAKDDTATVMDSDIARVILPLYPDLEAKFRINKHRPIAWAVRQNSPELLLRLNEFLVAHHVQAAANTASLKDWNGIVESGRLRMLTLNNPASYFMWRGELMGFDYELMKTFANEHKLHLAIVLKNSIPELFDALRQGEGDLIAASMTATAARESKGILFTTPYLYVSEQVVGRAKGPSLTALEQLPDYRVAVNPNTVFFPRIERVFEQHTTGEAALGDSEAEAGRLLAVEATTETLVSQVLQGDFDFTVADSHLVAIESSYHSGLVTPLSLTDDAAIAWGVRSDQPELTKRLNQFIQTQYRGLFYNMTYNKYFKNKRSIRRYQSGRLQEGGALSPYDDLVKKRAEQYGMDWRMLVSQMYQESKFNPKAVSFAGAEGLMQVMPRTARELGYSDLFNPENGIAAGSAYMDWLEDRFPGELDVQERLFFTLAAYNAGTGHVRDARKLAKQEGLDPNKWFDHVEKAMLKLSQPAYYKKARFGYVRGSEPVAYVREIHDRYLGYLGTDGN